MSVLFTITFSAINHSHSHVLSVNLIRLNENIAYILLLQISLLNV